jgi:hypothetical protein
MIDSVLHHVLVGIASIGLWMMRIFFDVLSRLFPSFF